MKQERGVAIHDVMRELAFRNHLRKLAEDRDRQVKRRKKKETCTAATEQVSSIKKYATKIHTNNNTTGEICQAGGVSGDQG